MKLIDLSGRKFGRLTVLERGPNYPHQSKTIPQWKCECECGRTVVLIGHNISRWLTKSCGCLRRELNRKRFVTHGHASAGKKRSREYTSWAQMHQRCSNPKTKCFHLYGGRGITVCRRWHKFENFIADMGKKPSRAHSIERTNNDLGYTPENCVWAKPVTQSNNRRSNRFYVFKRRRMTIRQILMETGSKVKDTTLRARLARGVPMEDALRP